MPTFSETWVDTVCSPPEGTAQIYIRARVGVSPRKLSGSEKRYLGVPVDPAAVRAHVKELRAERSGRMWFEALVVGSEVAYATAVEVAATDAAAALVDSGADNATLRTILDLALSHRDFGYRMLDTVEALSEQNVDAYEKLARARVDIERAKKGKGEEGEEDAAAKTMAGGVMERLFDRLLDGKPGAAPAGSGFTIERIEKGLGSWLKDKTDDEIATLQERVGEVVMKALKEREASRQKVAS